MDKDDLHLVSHAIPGSLAMAVVPGVICVMTLARIIAVSMRWSTPEGLEGALPQ